MISPRDKLDRARSARRLVLLATGASFAAAALLLGPGSGQSMLPAASTANAKESAPQAGRGWIGVQIQPVTTNIAESLGMKEDKGALIAEPLTDGPAAKAGILSGDVITALNDQPVNDIRDLAKQIGNMAPGGTAKLTIWRKGEEKTISLTLGEMPKQHETRAAAPKADADRVDAPKLGLMLASAEHVAGAGSEGVIVINLDRNGLAFEHGFKIGDIILDVGGKKSYPGRCAQCRQGRPQGWQASGVDAVEVGRVDKVRRRSDRSRLNRDELRSTGLPHQSGRNARRGQDKQEDRPRRLRGATQTLRKPVTTRLDPRSETTLPHVAAPPRSLTGRRIGADDWENAGKKELAARRTTRPLVGLRRRFASARSLSDPRPPTPRTDTWAIPVPHNCGGAAAAASRTSPRLKLRQ